MELRKIEGNGVELKKMLMELESKRIFETFDIVIAMNFRNTISLEIPFELLLNSFEYYCFFVLSLFKLSFKLV